jgi:hypothetical protein
MNLTYLRRHITNCILPIGASAYGAYVVNRKVAYHSESKDPCANPACHSMAEMMKLASANRGATKKKKETTKPVENPYPVGCPVDRELLGRSTWYLIHTIAANYPEDPSPQIQKDTTDFIISLSKVYPCPHCAEDFRTSVEALPPE